MSEELIVCIHGQLKRSCEICDLQSEIADLTRKLEERERLLIKDGKGNQRG